MIKGSDILEKSLSLLGERLDIEDNEISDFVEYAPHFINLMLSELYDIDLGMKGQKPSYADIIPQITSLNDTIPFCDPIAISLMPIGLAYYLCLDEDTERAAFFFRMYNDEKSRLRNAYKVSKRHKIRNIY